MTDDAPTAKKEGRTAVTRTASPMLGRQLRLVVEHEMPLILKVWMEYLATDKLTDEMVDCFVALGWLSSRQDPRLSPKNATKH